MMLCSRACVLLSPRDLVPSCFHEFMLSGSPTVMPSCYRASKLSYRKESGNALLFCYLASRLVFSDSLPSSLFIPSESIRSLSNSLPVLARTGFLVLRHVGSDPQAGRSMGETSPYIKGQPLPLWAGSPVASSLASKIVPAPRREHDFHVYHPGSE